MIHNRPHRRLPVIAAATAILAAGLGLVACTGGTSSADEAAPQVTTAERQVEELHQAEAAEREAEEAEREAEEREAEEAEREAEEREAEERERELDEREREIEAAEAERQATTTTTTVPPPPPPPMTDEQIDDQIADIEARHRAEDPEPEDVFDGVNLDNSSVDMFGDDDGDRIPNGWDADDTQFNWMTIWDNTYGYMTPVEWHGAAPEVYPVALLGGAYVSLTQVDLDTFVSTWSYDSGDVGGESLTDDYDGDGIPDAADGSDGYEECGC